jgi:hypothetical protein
MAVQSRLASERHRIVSKMSNSRRAEPAAARCEQLGGTRRLFVTGQHSKPTTLP